MDCAGSQKCYKKHWLKLTIVNVFSCYTYLGNTLVVTPNSLREEILELGLSQFYSGHFGTLKTHQRILECVWWPDIFADVQNKIRDCKICIVKVPKRKSMH